MHKYPAFVRAAAVVLSSAFLGGAALALQPQNEPLVMTDAAPLPAQVRDSIGAVILMDEPVLAQRDAMQQAMARSEVDTRSMGAGPSRLLQREALRDLFRKEEDREQRTR